MSVYADRVQESTTTTGTGNITLGGATTGFRTFSSAFDVGERISYAILGGSEWEVGDGYLSSSSVFVRENVHSSSNSGALVNFSAGTKNIWCNASAQQISTLGLVIAFRALMVPQ